MLFSHPVHQTQGPLVGGIRAGQKPSAVLEKKFIMTTSIIMPTPVGEGQSNVPNTNLLLLY